MLRLKWLPVLLFPILWGCSKTVYLMPVPAGDKVEYYEITPFDERRTTIKIGFVTNRLIAPPKSRKFYSKEFDQNMRFGEAFIQIGDGNASWDEITHLTVSEARQDQIALNLTGVYRFGMLPSSAELDVINPDTRWMINSLNEYLKRGTVKEITVYVHGANSSFYRGMAQGAQFRHFTGRIATMVVFSWPSAENLMLYKTDLANIEATIPVFTRFIKLLGQYSKAERINILAYSAGATLVARSLDLLGSGPGNNDRERQRNRLRLGTIYFAAPDTEYHAFLGQLHGFADLVDNVTVTVNEKDSVLAMSKKFVHKKSRLGAPISEETDSTYFKWAKALAKNGKLDVIYIDTDVIPDIEEDSHHYWYDSAWVSADALLALNTDASPEDRGLEKIIDDNGWVTWRFPPNYDEKIEQIVRKEVAKFINPDR